MQQMCKVVLVV